MEEDGNEGTPEGLGRAQKLFQFVSSEAVAEKEERIRKRLAAREAREKAAREAAGEDATATPPGGDAAPAAAAAPAPAE